MDLTPEANVLSDVCFHHASHTANFFNFMFSVTDKIPITKQKRSPDHSFLSELKGMLLKSIW